MKRLTYVSRFARPLAKDEIVEIGRSSAQRNAADDITGVLVTLGTAFFQIIEGEPGPIDALYERVRRDDRHTDVVCVRTEPDVDVRLFPGWSMNVIDLDGIEGDPVEPLKLLLRRMIEAQHIIGRYAPPPVARMIEEGLDPLTLPLRTIDRLVLFTDMVGFATINDHLPPAAVIELVQTYLEVCSTCIVRHGGEVNKFLGDGVMAYYPVAAVDDALHSCVDAVEEMGRIRADAGPDSPSRLLFGGFGLAAGTVIEGTMGSSVKVDYTIIGEPVNTAAGLESATRVVGSPIVMSEDVARAAGPDWTTRSIDPVDVGRGELVPARALDLPGGAFDLRAAVRAALGERRA